MARLALIEEINVSPDNGNGYQRNQQAWTCRDQSQAAGNQQGNQQQRNPQVTTSYGLKVGF